MNAIFILIFYLYVRVIIRLDLESHFYIKLAHFQLYFWFIFFQENNFIYFHLFIIISFIYYKQVNQINIKSHFEISFDNRNNQVILAQVIINNFNIRAFIFLDLDSLGLKY
jgi:hypothetical protein